jgi:hypothetical protein
MFWLFALIAAPFILTFWIVKIVFWDIPWLIWRAWWEYHHPSR